MPASRRRLIMDQPPSVTVITPTWQRHELLVERCVPSVFGQNYDGAIEHLVISDGPDPELEACLAGYAFQSPLWRLRTEALPEHDPAVWFGNRARLRGLELASGQFIAYIDDDNEWRPNHLELLIDKLMISGADFAYSRMLRHPLEDEVGAVPPRYAQVDTSILTHRAGLQPVGWNPGQRADPDWEAVSAWIEAGRSWAFVPEVTVDYYMRGAT